MTRLPHKAWATTPAMRKTKQRYVNRVVLFQYSKAMMEEPDVHFYFGNID
jgi:hypothetical protein